MLNKKTCHYIEHVIEVSWLMLRYANGQKGLKVDSIYYCQMWMDCAIPGSSDQRAGRSRFMDRQSQASLSLKPKHMFSAIFFFLLLINQINKIHIKKERKKINLKCSQEVQKIKTIFPHFFILFLVPRTWSEQTEAVTFFNWQQLSFIPTVANMHTANIRYPWRLHFFIWEVPL